MSVYVKTPRGRSRLDNVKPYQRSRFAAPHAQRSELEASVNNALLGAMDRKHAAFGDQLALPK